MKMKENEFEIVFMSNRCQLTYSNPSYPYDNSVCEAFFKTLKQEELYRHEYHSEAEMKKSVSDYITRYNTKRPHTYLHNRNPNRVEEEYNKKWGSVVHKSKQN